MAKISIESNALMKLKDIQSRSIVLIGRVMTSGLSLQVMIKLLRSGMHRDLEN
jgi:hypothetical protein